MKKKKGFTTIAVIILVMIAAFIIIKILNQNNNEITVTFDSKGGDLVESMKVKKGNSITLPIATREGYNFLGWYNEKNEKAESQVKVISPTTFYAQWEEVPKEYGFTVTFDSRGGSEVAKLTIACGKELTLPTTPTKDGYTFVSWVDKNERPILDQALLACEDVTLYANWEKKEEPKKEEPKPVEKTKEYSCPDGYTLNGTKCTIEGTVHKSCPEGTKTDGEKCVKTSDNNTGIRTCPTKTVQTTASHTETVEGEYYQQGAGYCGYYIYKTLTTKEQCESAYDKNTVWANNKCYAKTIINDYTTSCAEGYELYSTQKLAQWNIHNGALCLRIVDKINYCDDGYTLTSGQCIKTIDATVK